MNIVKNMEALARKGHEGAFRKGREHLPYIVHPEAVVKLLREWGYNEADDAVMLAVAWGHDLLEDTKVSDDEIVVAGGVLGPRVLEGIRTLTFKCPLGIPNEEYDQRKAKYVAGVANAPAEILVVKMADRLCNTLDFLKDGLLDQARNYLSKGAPLFARVGEMKHAAAATETLNVVRCQLAF